MRLIDSLLNRVTMYRLVEYWLIQTYAPYYRKATFYISDPNVMVDSVKNILLEMGIPGRQIKTDFFAGL